jgi:GNAT superfamily N-acetyltransferase
MVRFEAVPADAPPASDLLAAMVAEMDALYGPIDRPGMPSATPPDFAPPCGTFLVGFDESGTSVCAGGIKHLGDGAAEIKRMYVVPAARGRGLARVLLRALEDAARDLGHTVVRLDTGPHQPHAQALYSSAGYRPIGNYNANPVASYWGEKRLSEEEPRVDGGKKRRADEDPRRAAGARRPAKNGGS